jgi:hypothetical protein
MLNDTFEIYNPRKFFEEFVLRAYQEYLVEPLDQYRIKVAIIQADTMAERVWDTFKDGDRSKIGDAGSARAYREFLSKQCQDFHVIWDVHDGHKHVHLSRTNRLVSSASQTGIVRTGGAFQADAFVESFQVGKEEIVVVLDDGTQRSLAEALANVIGMWERVLETL